MHQQAISRALKAMIIVVIMELTWKLIIYSGSSNVEPSSSLAYDVMLMPSSVCTYSELSTSLLFEVRVIVHLPA